MPLALWTLKLICHLQQKWVSFHYYLYFEHEPSCQAWVGSDNPVFPWKEAQFSLQCIGASAPLLSPQAEPAELQTSWLCALGCAIFCSRVMSPWLTITAHSVLLFSPEPLNGSLAFNKTCIACSKVCFNPFLSGFFTTLYLCSPMMLFVDDFAVCFSSKNPVSWECFGILITVKDAQQWNRQLGEVGLDWSPPHGHQLWMEYIDASLLQPPTRCPSFSGLSLPEWVFKDLKLASWDIKPSPAKERDRDLGSLKMLVS